MPEPADTILNTLGLQGGSVPAQPLIVLLSLLILIIVGTLLALYSPIPTAIDAPKGETPKVTTVGLADWPNDNDE